MMEPNERSFIISPLKQEIDLKAGEIYEGSILIANPEFASENLEYKVSAKPYNISEKDGEPDFETISDWSQIVNWISIDEPEGVLEPNETRRVYFKITVPEDAPAGGQYAMIGVSSTPTTNAKGTQVLDTYTLASILYSKVDGETAHEGAIVENKVPSVVTSGAPVTRVTVENSGNVHENLKVEIKIKNFFTGEKISLTEDENDIYESLILPDSTRVVTRTLDGLPGLGLFEVTQDASYVGGSSVVTSVMLICPIWFMILVVFVVTLSLTAAVFKITRSILKKCKNHNFDDKNE